MGWSTRVDDMLAEYCEKSFKMYESECWDIICKVIPSAVLDSSLNYKGMATDYALKHTINDLEQGIQGLEYKLNSVASSRGDYPSN